MKYLRVEDAIKGFVGYAKIEGIINSEVANSKIANLAYDNRKKAYEYLKAHRAFDKMKPLLTNDNLYVRLCAATKLLNVYEEEALNVLEDIAKGEAHAFVAEMTIKEWKEGNLTF